MSYYELYTGQILGLHEVILPRLINDHIRFRKNFGGKPIGYRIPIWIDYGSPISTTQLKEKLYNIGTDGGGPNGWMEGDISIVDDTVAARYGYGGIELHLIIERIYVINVEINLCV